MSDLFFLIHQVERIFQASMQCRATFGPPAIRHLNSVSPVGR